MVIKHGEYKFILFWMLHLYEPLFKELERDMFAATASEGNHRFYLVMNTTN